MPRIIAMVATPPDNAQVRPIHASHVDGHGTAHKMAHDKYKEKHEHEAKRQQDGAHDDADDRAVAIHHLMGRKALFLPPRYSGHGTLRHSLAILVGQTKFPSPASDMNITEDRCVGFNTERPTSRELACILLINPDTRPRFTEEKQKQTTTL
ncbi:hypothetical protein [Acidithiobacillus albertensis]|uniref:hypothetical protein n=1 Tax=Acidithiobacillus albertensis TaxID=119978 RepID=UPI001177AC23|nr:hypothetical protein [Acidithiobacillus albertensis]